MKRQFLAGFIILSTLFSSCDKNQTIVRKIDGKWNVTSSTVSDGNATTTSNFTSDNTLVFDFDNCKLKKDEYCNMTTTQTVDGTTTSISQTYKVQDDGKTLVVKTGNSTSTMTISDIKKSSMTLSQTDGSGNTTSLKMSKAK